MPFTGDSTSMEVITEEQKPLLLENQTPNQVAADPRNSLNQRLISLDVFRGFTVLVCFPSFLNFICTVFNFNCLT